MYSTFTGADGDDAGHDLEGRKHPDQRGSDPGGRDTPHHAGEAAADGRLAQRQRGSSKYS